MERLPAPTIDQAGDAYRQVSAGLVQDNERVVVSSGRATSLDVSARTFIVPEVTSQPISFGRAVTRLRLTNSGGDSVQVELVFTPAGADGFDANAVKRAVVVA